MKNIWKWILEFLRIASEVKPPVTPDPVKPDPVKPADGDAIDLSSVTMHDSQGIKKAKITVKASDLRTNDGDPRFSFSWTAYNWTPDSGGCDGLLIAFWKAEGKWWGAYLEHLVPKTNGYTFPPPALQGVYHDDGGKRMPHPVRGQPWAVCIASKNLSERSNIIDGAWPIDNDNSVEE